MYRKRRSDIRIASVKEEAIVLDERDGLIHRFNPTASFVWQHCDGKTVAEIATLLTEQFDVSEAVAMRDVARIIEQLRELKLLDDASQ